MTSVFVPPVGRFCTFPGPLTAGGFCRWPFSSNRGGLLRTPWPAGRAARKPFRRHFFAGADRAEHSIRQGHSGVGQHLSHDVENRLADRQVGAVCEARQGLNSSVPCVSRFHAEEHGAGGFAGVEKVFASGANAYV